MLSESQTFIFAGVHRPPASAKIQTRAIDQNESSVIRTFANALDCQARWQEYHATWKELGPVHTIAMPR